MNYTKHLTSCSQCGGSGQQFKQDAFAFFRRWRSELNLTQAEVCEAVGISDSSQLSKFEQGHRVFSVKRLEDLADFYISKESKE